MGFFFKKKRVQTSHNHPIDKCRPFQPGPDCNPISSSSQLRILAENKTGMGNTYHWRSSNSLTANSESSAKLDGVVVGGGETGSRTSKMAS